MFEFFRSRSPSVSPRRACLPVSTGEYSGAQTRLSPTRKSRKWYSASFTSFLLFATFYIGFFARDNPWMVDSNRQTGSVHSFQMSDKIIVVPGHKQLKIVIPENYNGVKQSIHATNLGTHDPAKVSDSNVIERKLQPVLPACAKEGKAQSFLMVFMGHSGSSAILSELAQHPETYIKKPEPVDHHKLQNDTDGALQFTDKFFTEGRSKNKVPGFKIRPRHIIARPEKWRELIKKHNTRIIWQFRQNVFKQAVGEYSYRYLNDTSVIEGLRGNDTLSQRCMRGAGCRFRIHSMEYFHRLLKNQVFNDKSIANAVKELNREGCTLPLAYEEYLYAHDNAMSEAFSFLGLEPVQVAPLRSKATKDNLCEVIDNFEEVCHTFFACPSWRHMLIDSRNNCKCTQFHPAKLWTRSPFCEVS